MRTRSTRVLRYMIEAATNIHKDHGAETRGYISDGISTDRVSTLEFRVAAVGLYNFKGPIVQHALNVGKSGPQQPL